MKRTENVELTVLGLIHKDKYLLQNRKYTISEIINAVVRSGFVLKQFDEHPAWENPNVPGEFTLIAAKK